MEVASTLHARVHTALCKCACNCTEVLLRMKSYVHYVPTVTSCIETYRALELPTLSKLPLAPAQRMAEKARHCGYKPCSPYCRLHGSDLEGRDSEQDRDTAQPLLRIQLVPGKTWMKAIVAANHAKHCRPCKARLDIDRSQQADTVHYMAVVVTDCKFVDSKCCTFLDGYTLYRKLLKASAAISSKNDHRLQMFVTSYPQICSGGAYFVHDTHAGADGTVPSS